MTESQANAIRLQAYYEGFAEALVVKNPFKNGDWGVEVGLSDKPESVLFAFVSDWQAFLAEEQAGQEPLA